MKRRTKKSSTPKPPTIVLANLTDSAAALTALAVKKVPYGVQGTKFPPFRKKFRLYRYTLEDGSVVREIAWYKYFNDFVIYIKQLVSEDGEVIKESVWPEEALRELAI